MKGDNTAARRWDVPEWYRQLGKVRFLILLAALLAIVVTIPFVTDSPNAAGILTVLFALLIISAAVATSQHLKTGVIAISLALCDMVLTLLRYFMSGESGESIPLLVADHLTSIVFITYCTCVMIIHLFKVKRVTFNTIACSICVYLMMTIAWSHLYSMLDTIEPGSFRYPLATEEDDAMNFGGEGSIVTIYYSFTTITTLGYGDVVPFSPVAKMSASMEALFGQLFLVILVARLVSIHASGHLFGGERDT